MNVKASYREVNLPVLEAELRTAAGEAYQGWTYNRAAAPDEYLLHFAEGTPQATIDAAMRAYAAHDPSVLTDAQQAEAEREAAAAFVAGTDLAGLAAAVEKAGTLADVKALLVSTLELVSQLAVLSPQVTAAVEARERAARAAKG